MMETTMTLIPENPDALLTRDTVAKALTEAGFPVKAKTLATKATRGGGPAYQLFGTRPLYRWRDALAWAQSRLSAPRGSTSEETASTTRRTAGNPTHPVPSELRHLSPSTPDTSRKVRASEAASQ
jgi:hypothetical protein